MAWYGDQPPPDQDLFRLRAIVEAGTPDEAVARVRDSLPADPSYTVGRAGTYGGSTWICQMRVRTTPGTVASLITWLEQIGTVEFSQPDASGVCDLRVETSTDQMEDAEAAIARRDVDNPGQIEKPE
jgi:hypothetical protein